MPQPVTIRIGLRKYKSILATIADKIFESEQLDTDLYLIVQIGIIYYILQDRFGDPEDIDEDMWTRTIETIADLLSDFYRCTDMAGLEDDVAAMICECYISADINSMPEFTELQDEILNIVESMTYETWMITKASFDIDRGLLKIAF